MLSGIALVIALILSQLILVRFDQVQPNLVVVLLKKLQGALSNLYTYMVSIFI